MLIDHIVTSVKSILLRTLPLGNVVSNTLPPYLRSQINPIIKLSYDETEDHLIIKVQLIVHKSIYIRALTHAHINTHTQTLYDASAVSFT